MTQVGTLVLPTSQCFVAHNSASVDAVGVACPPQFRVDVAANTVALVFVTVFQFVADTIAPILVQHLNFFGRHQILLLFPWVLDFVAWQLLVLFSTQAFFLGFALAPWAVSIVANCLALVNTAGKVPVATGLAGGDGLRALLPLSAQQLFDGLVSTRAELDSGRVIGAGTALASVADLLAVMVPAV